MNNNQAVQDAVDFAEADLAVSQIQEGLDGARKRSGERLPELSEAMGMESRSSRSPEADESIPIYNRLDGTSSESPIYMLRNFLRRRFAEENWIPEKFWGQRVFTIHAAEAPVMAEGSVLCDFNPESPSYTYVVTAGVSHIRCTKHNLQSEYEKRRHQASYHESANKAVVEYRAITEQRTRDDAMMELLSKLSDREETPAPKRGRPKKDEDGATE